MKRRKNRCAGWRCSMSRRWLAGVLVVLTLQRALGADGISKSQEKVSLDGAQSAQRAVVEDVMSKATLVARGPRESFPCRPEHYYWFLDHPDRAVVAWRRLGAKCVSITSKAPGLYQWSDDAGSEVIWETVARGPEH